MATTKPAPTSWARTDDGGRNLTDLVRELSEVVDLPEALRAELALAAEVEATASGAAVAAARAALMNAGTTADYLKARAAFNAVLVAEHAVSDTFRQVEAEALRRRLRGALGTHADELFAALVARFNGVVDEFRLNSVPVPDLTGVTTPLQLTSAELEALAAWRRASRELQRVYGAYRRLAGHVVSDARPEPDDDLTATFALFDIETPDQAAAVAEEFAALRAGTGRATTYGPLVPFAIGGLCGGIRLDLTSPAVSTARRRALEPLGPTASASRSSR